MKVQRLNQMPNSLKQHKLKQLRALKEEESKQQAKYILISLGLFIMGIIICNVLDLQ